MKVYLNDIAYQANSHETILDFVRRVENHEAIPTMCQDDRLDNFGSCRVCSVEVAREKGGFTKTVASCHTPVFEGAYIYHQTEKIKRLRKNILELVLTDYPSDKVFPEKGRKPLNFKKPLLKLVYQMFAIQKERTKLGLGKDNSHPYIKSDLAQCINCYRCVRACEEIQGEMVLGMSGRGFATQIIKGFDTNFDLSACVSCGACVQTCPTEALLINFLPKR